MPASQRTRVRHWSKNVREVAITHDSLHIRIEGGAENGEFLYVGFTSSEIKYRKGSLRVGDILIELNDEPVVGLTLHDLMSRINKAGKKVNFKVVEEGGGISKDMREYLAQEFPSSNEVDLDLQETIRDNLYSRTVPCTTRTPRSSEEPGIDYIFVSKEQFEEMEENGDFIESGTYNGHYYGTLKPKLKVESMTGLQTIKEQKEISTENSETNVLEMKSEIRNGDVIVHENGDLNHDDQVKDTKLTKNDNSLENHFTQV